MRGVMKAKSKVEGLICIKGKMRKEKDDVEVVRCGGIIMIMHPT